MSQNLDLPLGLFAADDKGVISGRIFLLGMPATPLKLQPATSAKGQSYYKALARDGSVEQEVGIGYSKMARNGKPYIKLTIDNPTLPASLVGYLFEDEMTKIHVLKWSREPFRLDPEQKAAVAPAPLAAAPKSPAL